MLISKMIPSALVALAVCGSAGAQTANQPANQPASQPVLRIYDARDLASVLPRGGGGGGAVPILSDIPLVSRFFVAGGRREEPAGAQPAGGSATDVVVARLCAQLGLESERLVEGVYLVKGEEKSQETFGGLLEKTRGLYLGAYELELACTVVPVAASPAVGSTTDTSAAMIRTRQTVGRRVETLIGVSETESYVEDWTPVVSNDAVGYDPQVSQVERGLQVTVLLGSAPDAKSDGKAESRPEALVPVLIRGQISDARVEPFKAVQNQPPGTLLEIGLPTTMVRSISAETRLAPGKSTVVAVVPGFKAGESIVIAVTVRELK